MNLLRGLLVVSICVLVRASSGQGVIYPKIEATFNVTGISTNPAVLFDYSQADVEVSISQPDSSTVVLPAFYDGGTTWRVRHAPTNAGNYQITGITLNGSAAATSNVQPTNWVVTGFPAGAGYVRVDPGNPRRFITSNGRRFFPVGENVAWDSGGHNVTSVLPKLGAAHGDWARIWMDAWDGKNLDWNSDGSSPGALGVLNLTVAQKWDAIVAAADAAGIHFQMTLHHHGEYSTTVDPNWSTNPYNVSNHVSSIGFLTNAVQFFTNATAKAVTKLKLRYAIARWGYSPSVMAWELFNEVQFTDAANSGQWNIIQAWHDEMAQFIRSHDPYRHLITTSSALDEPIWDQTDYYQHHDYPSDLITDIQDAPTISASQPVASDYSGECGINFTPHAGISPPIWAGLMAGQSAAAMPWYWDTIDANNDYFLIQAAADFVTVSGLGDQDVLTRSSPQVAGGGLGPLQFGLGGGYANNTGPDTFTVGGNPPDGVGSAPSYLQGNFHRPMTPNGYTFLVNYPQAGTFSVQVLTIAASGAGLQITNDGVLRTNISWPATGSDVQTNFTATISVAAGSHTLKLWNPGQDWINLGNLTLNPYAAQLGAYAVGNTNFQAVWIWNRTNVFLTNATTSLQGTVNLAGLNPGPYSVTWWDTFGAGAISNLTITVSATNPSVTLTTPPVLRSVALFAGLAAHAGLVVPNLAIQVASNSPPFNLPLSITNSGGLPLSYSISSTNPIPSWLSLSSTNGYVSRTGQLTLLLGFNPTGLAPGTHTFTLFVNTSDPSMAVTAVPISFSIIPNAPRLQVVGAAASQFVFKVLGDAGVPYVVQTSSNLLTWVSVSTNTLPGGVLYVTNALAPPPSHQFWRALWEP
ncbi:MAG: hypothetical protein C5B50_26125 [Verrucomicrobia bacterium]|nr:MAG: hypothetical protein C5B50_26125 [Verrucomicrobiota bacterium]